MTTTSGSPDATEGMSPAGQRALAVRLFNRTWELLDLERDAAADREALATAMASRLHWTGIGTDENLAAGDWLVAHVASRLGHAELALDFASAAHERVSTSSEQLPAWLVASTLEGLARAHAVAGHDDERDAFAADARRVLEAVEDDEDREIVEGQLATIPGLSD